LTSEIGTVAESGFTGSICQVTAPPLELAWPSVAYFVIGAGRTRIPRRIGVTSGPHEEIFEVVKKVAEREYGLHIRIVSFNDYIQPDAALDAGDLDANSYQHRPFLASQVRARGYKLVGIGRTWIGPIGLYSKHYRKFTDLPDGATIGIPNDPANESRILLLQKAGSITLRQGIDPVTGINATPLDITANPKHFRFKEVDAAQLPRTLDDFDATTVNADYAIKAGLNPAKDTILVENGSSVYACLIAMREHGCDQALGAATSFRLSIA
jgi:D-methionine transport system substrate-binding protein